MNERGIGMGFGRVIIAAICLTLAVDAVRAATGQQEGTSNEFWQEQDDVKHQRRTHHGDNGVFERWRNG